MSPPARSNQVDYLLLGHVSKDLCAEGPRLGGAVAYSGLTANAAGMSVGIVTAAAADLDLGPLEDLQVQCLLSPETTTFENVYTGSIRRQRLTARARPLELSDVPQTWAGAGCVHLAPIADELPLEAGRSFPSATLFCTPQGWLRQWDEAGHVFARSWERLIPVLDGVRAVVLGWEDINRDVQAAASLAEIIPLLVLTAGASGADLYIDGQRVHIEAKPARQVDPTGAGDVFAAAFFVGLLRGVDPVLSARRAATIAARSVEADGLRGVPSAGQIAAFEAAAS